MGDTISLRSMASDCRVVEPASTSLEPMPASPPGLTPVRKQNRPSPGVWSSAGAQMLDASPGVLYDPTGMVDSHSPVSALSSGSPISQNPNSE